MYPILQLDFKICAKANACTHKHTQALEHSPTYNTCAIVEVSTCSPVSTSQAGPLKIWQSRWLYIPHISGHFLPVNHASDVLQTTHHVHPMLTGPSVSLNLSTDTEHIWISSTLRGENPRDLLWHELVSLFAISAHHISTYLSWCTTFNCKLWTDSQAFCILSR